MAIFNSDCIAVGDRIFIKPTWFNKDLLNSAKEFNKGISAEKAAEKSLDRECQLTIETSRSATAIAVASIHSGRSLSEVKEIIEGVKAAL